MNHEDRLLGTFTYIIIMMKPPVCLTKLLNDAFVHLSANEF